MQQATLLPTEILLLILQFAMNCNTYSGYPPLFDTGYLLERQAVCSKVCLVSHTWNAVATPLLNHPQLAHHVRRLYFQSWNSYPISKPFLAQLFRWPQVFQDAFLYGKLERDIHSTIKLSPSLHTLCINFFNFRARHHIHDTGVVLLKSPALSRSHIRHLIITANHLFDTPMPSLTLPELRALTFYDCYVSVEKFFSSTKLPRLCRLQLIRTNFAAPIYSMLESNHIFSSIEILEFHYVGLLNSTAHTGDIPSIPNLTTFHLVNDLDSKVLGIVIRDHWNTRILQNVRYLVLGHLHNLPELFSIWRFPARLECVTVFVCVRLDRDNTRPFKLCLEASLRTRRENELKVIVNVASRAPYLDESVLAFREWCHTREVETDLRVVDLERFVIQRT
ncbi:hypothetical protein ABKN59_011848 [Abortiporus biennis]